jgi:uncharacterized protein
MDLVFEWDETKARGNLRKHGVAFEEARSIFHDPFLLTFPDLDHSDDEDRFLSLGLSARGRVLVVAHTDRNGSIRLIGAPPATRRERASYEEGDYDDHP